MIEKDVWQEKKDQLTRQKAELEYELAYQSNFDSQEEIDIPKAREARGNIISKEKQKRNVYSAKVQDLLDDVNLKIETLNKLLK